MRIDKLRTYKKILLVGYGYEGKATHEFLTIMHPKAKIGIADAALNGPDYLKDQHAYELAIKSPGIHKSLITIPHTTASSIFLANTKGITIGVTGTKGKSTTTNMIYHILKTAGKNAKLLGNITHKLSDIGMPMLSALLEPHDKHTIFVCELSSHQLDDIHYSPNIAVFTSFFPEHMDFHGSLNAYWKAKTHITSYQKPGDIFVYNPDFQPIKQLARTTRGRSYPKASILPIEDKDISLPGKHNRDNISLAVTVARKLGIDDTTIVKAIKSYRPLPHRLEKIATHKGIDFIDDAISTTPQSTIAALDAIHHAATIFLGGLDRGYDFMPLAHAVSEHKIGAMVLFPNSGKKVMQALQDLGAQIEHFTTDPQTTYTVILPHHRIKVLETRSMEEAVRFAYAHTPKGRAVLLSNASPSYSIWKNFEEKGADFAHWVKKLSK
jgi:UDP-N-acetylmuramoylalanine--D-glutamate ligase